MGMTIGEKIIARVAKVDQVKAGEIHTIEVDRLMSNDGTTHLTIDMYHNQLKHPKIADKDKLVFIMDHNVPAENPKTAAAHRKMRNFAKEHEIKLYEGKGVCHQIMVENHVCPGEFIMGADSHTCTYGALGAFGTGIGCTDFLYAMVTGQSWVLVPDTIRFNLHGKLREGVYARDLMLSIIGMVGANGCNYKIMEFAGEGAHNLDIDERLVLCNLAVEAGAKTGIVEPDEKVVEYVESRGRKAENLFKSDDDAVFEKVYDINLDEIKPVVARPHQIDDVVDAKEVKDVKIDEAFLGSCNNGRIEELRVAAEILKGKKVSDSVRFLIAPASNEVYIPSKCDRNSRVGIANVLRMVKSVQSFSRNDLRFGGCFLTQYDERKKICKEAWEDCREALGEKLLSVTIPTDTKVEQTTSCNKPVYLLGKNGRAAQSYLELTKVILKEDSQK